MQILDSKQTTWRGKGLYFDGHTSRALTIDVTIAPDGITVHPDTGEAFFSWKQLKITSTAGGGYVRIEVKQSGTVISLQSAEAVDALAANNQIRRRPLGRLTHKQQVLWGTIGFIVVTLLFFLFGLDVLVDFGVRFVPSDLEAKLGSSVLGNITSGQTTASDSSTLHVLEKISNILEKFDTTEQTAHYNIILIEDTKTKNAFALPGGYIVVYRGILDIIENEDELFALLGHEAGHVVLRHGVKRIARTAVIGFITSVFLGDLSGLSAVLLDNGSVLLNLSYDRREELEADEFGLRAIQRLAINPHAMITLLESLKAEEGTSGWVTFLSTHPDIDDRLLRLKSEVMKGAFRLPRQKLSRSEWNTLKRSRN